MSSELPHAQRRDRLKVAANPGTALDYLNVLRAEAPGAEALVTLRYVPDKLTLESQTFADYLTAFESYSDKALEELAIAILEDINNEVVPRWVQVTAVRTHGDTTHRVLVEDRQPKWDNPALLARLE